MSDSPVSTPRSVIERQLGPDDIGARGFLKWLKVSMPSLYRGIEGDLKKLNRTAASVAANSPTGLGAFGEAGSSFEVPASSAPASTTWADSVSKLIAAYGQYKLTDAQLDAAKKIVSVNLQRAQDGLRPLPYDAGQLGVAPTVNFGLSNDTMSIVKWGALAAAAYFALKALRRA